MTKGRRYLSICSKVPHHPSYNVMRSDQCKSQGRCGQWVLWKRVQWIEMWWSMWVPPNSIVVCCKTGPIEIKCSGQCGYPLILHNFMWIWLLIYTLNSMLFWFIFVGKKEDPIVHNDLCSYTRPLQTSMIIQCSAPAHESCLRQWQNHPGSTFLLQDKLHLAPTDHQIWTMWPYYHGTTKHFLHHG